MLQQTTIQGHPPTRINQRDGGCSSPRSYKPREGGYPLVGCLQGSGVVGLARFLVLDLRLDIIGGIAQLDFKGRCLIHQILNEDVHPSSQSQHWATKHEFISPKHLKKYIPRWRVDSFWIL